MRLWKKKPYCCWYKNKANPKEMMVGKQNKQRKTNILPLYIKNSPRPQSEDRRESSKRKQHKKGWVFVFTDTAGDQRGRTRASSSSSTCV